MIYYKSLRITLSMLFGMSKMFLIYKRGIMYIILNLWNYQSSLNYELYSVSKKQN
jgi:hypothetical protein